MTFEQAAEQIKQLANAPDNQTLLRLYSLFKQGSDGDVQGKRPGMLDIRGRAKYDAWKELSGTSQDDARSMYVSLVQELL